MRKILSFFFIVLFCTSVFAQNQESLFKSRINLLNESMQKKDLKQVSDFFDSNVSYTGNKGKELTLVILNSLSNQDKTLGNYTISNISKEVDKYRVELNAENAKDTPFNFLFDESGNFFEINLYSISIQGGISAPKLEAPEVIPFNLKGTSVLFSVKINENPKERVFFFDTGATSTVIDSALAEELGLKVISKQQTSGANGSQVYEIVSIDSLRIGNIVLTNVTAPKVNLRKFDIEAIIGYDLLKSYTVQIDYDKKEFTFYNTISELDSLYKEKLNFSFQGVIKIPVVEIPIVLKNGEVFKGKAFFDSGAGLNFVFNTNIVNDNNLLSKFKPLVDYRTKTLTSGEGEVDYLGTVKSLSFFDHTFNDVPVNISQSKSGVNAMPDLLGILGNEILYRFNWIFDYANKTMYYQKNSLYQKSFIYPATHFTIKQSDDKQKMFFDRVQASSKEAKAGIVSNLEIISVNGKTSSDFLEIAKLLKEENISLDIIYLNKKGKKAKWKIKSTQRVI